MRAGTKVLGIAMALLFGGIATTSIDGWKSTQAERQATFDASGATAVDLRAIDSAKVTFAKQARPVFLFRSASPDEVPPLTAKREGDALVFSKTLPDERMYRAELRLPVVTGRILGERLELAGEAPVGVLRVEAQYIDWAGDAERLEVRLRTAPAVTCGGVQKDRDGTFTFAGGRVGVLRVAAAGGSIDLGDISRVDAVELHVDPRVKLTVASVRDLARIRIFEVDIATPPDDAGAPARSEGDARAAIACTAF